MFDDAPPRIKICGITSMADATLVVNSGADAIGLIYASSVRQVVGDVAGDIVARYARRVWCIGVFRNQEDHDIIRLVERDGVRAVQLHDPASDALLDALAARDVTVLRAMTVQSCALTSHERDHVVAVIVDSAQPGSGVANDWQAVRALHFDVPMIVAGGITADNVGDVVRMTSTWGVDVASGVEAAHGVKDPLKIASFVSRARTALTQKGAQ